ncbi:uncharacterized protein LOC123406328 isoform X2 [Hordeum vulgare subsp. vulgare]|uniref:uncharacterized protein LOC123406328 isoform X2 n=1 Tax=Hordeum vulgare subsp. vulgare TaxID=112509 RepID=UPI001D1A5998|nr:uncharacterized protein LOC123406328 isoform X2 [Hordeum vulgare subsp. vulgare]
MLKILQQATVIANSTNFRVQSYYGDGKNPRDHGDWETEMGESEGAIFRNDSLDTYCQSDGARPYLVNIQFQKKVQLQVSTMSLRAAAAASAQFCLDFCF